MGEQREREVITENDISGYEARAERRGELERVEVMAGNLRELCALARDGFKWRAAKSKLNGEANLAHYLSQASPSVPGGGE